MNGKTMNTRNLFSLNEHLETMKDGMLERLNAIVESGVG